MKRKLFLGLAALAALTITSCQKDLVINQVPDEQPIEFGTYVGRDAQTKATSIDELDDMLTANGGTGFGVFAYHTNGTFTDAATPNFMYNQLVTGVKEGEGTGATYTWSYSPLKYWPNNTNDKVSFFAYAPYDAQTATEDSKVLELSDNTVAGTPTVTYYVKSDVSKHKDLLWANPVMNQSKQTITGNIKFAFNHALSRIGFKVQALVDQVNGDSNDGELNDATHTATAVASETTIRVESVKLTGKFYEQGTLVYTLGTGSNPTYTAAFSTLTVPANEWTINLQNNSTEGQYGNFTEVADNVTETATQLNNNDSYLMIIPQDFTTTTGNKLKLEIVYTVTTTDSKLNEGKSTVTNTITTGEFNMPTGVSFEAGKAYNLVLHLGMTSVKLDAQVSSWSPTEDGTDYSVNVPINTVSANS